MFFGKTGVLHEPRSKAIVGVPKLRELRVSHARGISRIFYLVGPGPSFVLLHGFTKKTQKTPRHEIDLAVARMNQYREVKHG
jgi:phage-related protein